MKNLTEQDKKKLFNIEEHVLFAGVVTFLMSGMPIIFITISIVQGIIGLNLYLRGNEVDANVISYTKSTCRAGSGDDEYSYTCYVPTVRFVTDDNKVITGKIKSEATSRNNWNSESVITVLYDRNYPELFRAKTFNALWKNAVIGIPLCLIFLRLFLGASISIWKESIIGFYLKKHGKKVEAEVTKIEGLKFKNGRNYWIVTTEWEDEEKNKKYTFKSDEIIYDPTNYKQDRFTVYFDPNRPEKYFIDMEYWMTLLSNQS